MFNLKELKLVKQLKTIKPRLKWLMFSQMQDYKINSNYIDMICPDEQKTSNDYNTKLENNNSIKLSRLWERKVFQ